MFIIRNKKIFLTISAVLVSAAILSLVIFGLNLSIDFKGGALTEVVYETARPAQDSLNESLASLALGTILLQPVDELGYIVKSRDLSDTEHGLLLETLSGGSEYPLNETSFNSIGPSIGHQLARKAVIAIILVALAIILFIAFAFRKVSKPVSSWKYGLIAIVALLHDVIIPVGIFATYSYFSGIELNTLFVVAVLTILGLSVSDTIVIFDRIRENLKDEATKGIEFGQVVGMSLGQSYARSISTSFSTILVLLALFFFGPDSTALFALILTVGMFFGTYSSIFLASPLLVLIQERQDS